LPEKLDDMLDNVEANGPQLIRYGDKTAILATKENFEDHLAGKSFEVDDFLAAIPQS
jgi:hypothetical protein